MGRTLYDSTDPQEEPLPGRWDKLEGLKRLCILRCIRPDKVVLGVQKFVIAAMGEKFVRPPPFDLQACYDESSCVQPLVFVLAPGSDPMGSVLEAAEAIGREVGPISLGQGQGPVAEALIEKSRKEGSWVVLQNCHLAESFMTRFEEICDKLAEPRPHENFRLWCTTCPSPIFPTAVLQNGIKMAIEPPKGLRANLVGSYSAAPIANPGYLESNAKPEKFRKLCYSLCIFHALLIDRNGRCNQPPMNEDEDSRPEQELQNQPILGSIAEDEVVDGPAWTISACPGTGDSPDNTVCVKSLKWPGAYAVAFGNKFTNIYCGFGCPSLRGVSYKIPATPGIQPEWALVDEEISALFEEEDRTIRPSPNENTEEEE